MFPRFFRSTGSGQIGPICPRGKIWETFFANTLSFTGTKIFPQKMFPQLDPSLRDSLSMKKTAPHGAPRRDIRSPWRQLLSLPIPCHAHWPRSYCQSPAHPPAICGKPCFRGPSGCMRGAGTFGPLLRAGCAGAAWVRHGNLGSGMRAGRRCLAPRVGSVRWAGSLRATRARALVALAGA